jgi:hypothetical protein
MSRLLREVIQSVGEASSRPPSNENPVRLTDRKRVRRSAESNHLLAYS